MVVNICKKLEAKLSRLQYLNRHKTKFSNNWKKAQLKIAQLHSKIANIRKDTLHKLTTYLAKNHNPPHPPGRELEGWVKT
ncbi:transposase [Okeania sp. KiyG1]|uniref:transposase n=1 Tax=Okeania sp. KiyG1 TaxID=2720165 RepID=UPI001F26DCAA|nr:transposase [Okeania sp. KiyG1]